jgi:hypothetical protein
MLTIACPLRARLSIHAAAGMGIVVRHVRVRPVGRVLRVRVRRGGRRDGRIYRYFVVRLVRGGLMATPILLGQRRTVWLLLCHTSAAHATGCWMVWTLQVLWKGPRPRRMRINAVLRGRSGRRRRRIGNFLLRWVLRSSRCGICRRAFRIVVPEVAGIRRGQTCLRVFGCTAFHKSCRGGRSRFVESTSESPESSRRGG